MNHMIIPLVFFFLPFNSDYTPDPAFSGIILSVNLYTHEYEFEHFTVPLFVDEVPCGTSVNSEDNEDLLVEEVDDNPAEIEVYLDLTTTQ